MDPFTIIGTISSVIAFIDFGYELISAAREIHGSKTGMTKVNNRIELLSANMEALSIDLAATQPASAMSMDELRLSKLAQECRGLSQDLRKLLEKIKAKDPSSKRQRFASVARDYWNKDDKQELEARLDKYRQQLHIQLTQTSRLEILNRLDAIMKTGKCQDRELQSINHQLAILQGAISNIKLSSSLLNDVQPLLNLTEKAADKVLQNKLLEALRFEGMESRYEAVDDAHSNTFDWILEGEGDASSLEAAQSGDDVELIIEPGYKNEFSRNKVVRNDIRGSFVDWLLNGKGIFHVSGKPGAGKSTLMKHIVESPKTSEYIATWSGKKQLVVATFFFWRHGTELQRSFYGLLRSLLYHVLRQCVENIQLLFPTQWQAARDGLTVHFSKAEIQKSFATIMSSPEIYHSRKFVFFIDGLDEFEGRDETLIQSLFSWTDSGLDDIKICVSSRELPIFEERFSRCPKFRLQEVTQHDILAYVNDKLQGNEDAKSLLGDKDIKRLGHLVVHKAEGVFLWVSLALRLLERGLLEEDSIEDLESSIDVLPSEVERLFQVIFDSIKKEPHPAKRRKAMATLSLAIDEVEISCCRRKLDLLCLSFIDDYDRDMNFADSLKSCLKGSEVESRLRRCRKQVNGGCRGFLSIETRFGSDLSDYFRTYDVRLSHRSLIEFFKKSEVQASIEQYTQGFNKLQFYCQSLIAELKISLPQTDIEDIITPNTASERDGYFTYLSPSGLGYLTPDIYRLIGIFFHTKETDASIIIWALNQLKRLAKAEMHSKSKYYYSCIYRWAKGRAAGWVTCNITCHSSDKITLAALSQGMYELWPTDEIDEDVREALLLGIQDALMTYCIDKDSSFGYDVPSFDRLLRSLTCCLASGTSANAPIQHGKSNQHTIGIWHNLIWHSIWTSKLTAPHGPVWLLFLLHGADTNFWVTFEKSSHDGDSEANESKYLSVIGQFGADRHQPYSPLLIREDHGGIVELAESQGWSVSLRDIVTFWFPAHAHMFQRLIDLNETSTGNLSQEELRVLRREYGFDLESWQPQEWTISEPLFTSWTGISEILDWEKQFGVDHD